MELVDKLLNEDECEGLISISLDVDGAVIYKFDDGTVKIFNPRSGK